MPLKSFCFLLLFGLLLTTAHGQESIILPAQQLANGQPVELDKLGWKYSPNDEPRFADPQFDDRAWDTLNGTTITLNSIPKSGWRGIGWFRLHLHVAPGGEEWTQGRPQDDDVTFVVVKVREDKSEQRSGGQG